MSLPRSHPFSQENEDETRAYNRFIQDDEDRSSKASTKIIEYVDRLSTIWPNKKSLEKVRDESLAFLKEQRESEYYRDIKAKVVAGEKVTPNEYYYFVLTSDNLQLVNVEMLEDAEQLFDFQNCNENLFLVKAALNFQHAKTPEEKKRFQQDLADGIRFYCVNGIRPLFLNLAGINISGADLMDVPKENRGKRSRPHLNLADLSGAKMERCNMFWLDIQYSDLTGASLSNVYGDRKGDKCGPVIYGSFARNACFDGVELTGGASQATDFTGASFKHATIRNVCLESIFDNVNFEGATITDLRDTRAASFKNANFADVKLTGIDFCYNDFTGARFINRAHVNTPSGLMAELDQIADRLFVNLDITTSLGKKKMQAIQDLIARDVERFAAEKSADPAVHRELLDAAIQHHLFHHQENLITTLTSEVKSIYNNTLGTLFSGFGKYYSENTAVKYLEEVRDRLGSVKQNI